MKVPHVEGLASHNGPESCVGDRKGAGEALTGERAGQVLSRESEYGAGCRRGRNTWKATQDTSLWQEVSWPRVVEDPEHARKLLAREPGGPTSALWRWPLGSRREPLGGTTAMHGCGKSDRPIGTGEATEQKQVGVLLAEDVEGRGLAEGNLFRQNKFRAQDRERSQYGEP